MHRNCVNTEKQAQRTIAAFLGGTDDANYDAVIINKIGILGLVWQIKRAVAECDPLLDSVSSWIDESLNLSRRLTKKSFRNIKSYNISARQNETLRIFYDGLKQERGLTLVPYSGLLKSNALQNQDFFNLETLWVWLCQVDGHLMRLKWPLWLDSMAFLGISGGLPSA